MSHLGNDWLDELRFEEKMEEEEAEIQPVYDEYKEWEEVKDQFHELTDIPRILYKECREEGMDKETAIEETFTRFYE